MVRIEVCTWDYGTGKLVVDHVWKVARHHSSRKLKKLQRRVNRWYNRAVESDHSTDHVVYVRSI